MLCPGCGSENPEGKKFCGVCGSSLALPCPACGSPNPPGMRFCGDCGVPLEADAPSSRAAARREPSAERRLVSVLFADLVGFTSLSESHDAEDTRELLSRYFDTCRRLIGLYGGTVEKFIGDAVMAVWGTPTATEDDAERAVRAALDVVAAVATLGEEMGVPGLRARAGVLTGEAAVTLGAEGEGMVAGDLVNTASRIQSAAEPGSVFVGASTRRATEPTVVYEEAGAYELKGKQGLVPVWKALRIVSGARGALKSHGLEAPFVGRDREFRQIKDFFHTCAAEGRAHLVSVTGIAGIGKSRLGWEFYKYLDGLAETTYWHRGRCLAYGEGVTYWALADMVRMRCRIGEDDDPTAAAAKLRLTLEEQLLDAEERAFVEPRLAHLLGLGDHQARDKQDLFAAWRLFFERLADTYPTVLAFEDMQWADSSLLDFVEYLLEWSRNRPLLILTLARPELLERRPNWGAGLRNFSSLYLEPLSTEAMELLLAGLVPGLPASVRAQILARAEGVPLYAVETVRMLLDRQLLVQEGPVYRPTGELGELEVPETLQALIAARLDGLPPEERRVLQDGAVLGKTFTRAGLAALGGLAETELAGVLQSLVRKEVLSLQADPRSPEHGQYGFLQDLLRRVAYETLARSDRKARHLAAAAFLELAPEQEVVEVVASHYLNAFEAAPDSADATEIKARALSRLADAGERAASLAASEEAERYFEQAAGLCDDPCRRARLLDRAGQMAWKRGAAQTAIGFYESSISLCEGAGELHDAARTSGRLAEVERWTGRFSEALERMERAYAVIAEDEPDEDMAELAARLAMAHWSLGHVDEATERIEPALEIAESLWLPKVLVRGFIGKGAMAHSRGRPQEALAFLNHALRIAHDTDDSEQQGKCHFLLSDNAFHRDRYADAVDHLERNLAIVQKIGDRLGGWTVIGESTYPLYMLGRWDEALAAFAELPEEQIRTAGLLLGPLSSVLEIHLHRGDTEEARRVFSLYARLTDSSDPQDLSAYAAARAALAAAEGRPAEALAAGVEAIDHVHQYGLSHQCPKQGFVHAVEAAIALGDAARAEELLQLVDDLPPGRRPPYLEAHALRFRARLSGNPAGYAAAASLFRQLELPFWLAVTLLERGETNGLDEAREIFQRLGAAPWLRRTERALGPGQQARVG